MSSRTPEAEPLLTPAEVATMFRVDPKTVTRWAKAGKLTSIRTLGGHRRYRETEVRALLAGVPERREAPAAGPEPGVEGLDVSLQAKLRRAGITTVKDLCAESADGLLDLGLRPSQVDQVRLVLYRKNLALRGDVLGEVA